MSYSYIIYGSENSPYSVKVRAYARFKGIPFEWKNARTSPGYHDVAKIPIIPAVRAPDGSGMQDSTPIMERWDKDFPSTPDTSAHPNCPVLRFVSILLEEFGDEWANKWMFHYRWARPIDQRIVSLRLANEIIPDEVKDDSTLVETSEAIRARMMNRGFAVGSNEVTGPMIEKSFRDGIAQLEHHLQCGGEGSGKGRRFLFGGRPSFGDFGLACQIYQALIDPTAGKFLRDNAPRVSAWCSHVTVGDIAHPSNGGDWETWNQLRPTLEPFLRNQVGGVFLKWMLANAKCVQNRLEECEVLIPSLGTWRNIVGGPQRYQLKSLLALQAKFAEAAAQDELLVEVMKSTGCLDVISLEGSMRRTPFAKL